jgi:CrcB protein
MPTTLSLPVLSAVALGGACGAVARHVVSLVLAQWCPRFPMMGTLVVNLVGCLLIGVLAAVLVQRDASEVWRHLLVAGFLGGLTTFSTFGFQTVELLREDRLLLAIVNILANLVPGLLLVAAGLRIGQRIIGE